MVAFSSHPLIGQKLKKEQQTQSRENHETPSSSPWQPEQKTQLWLRDTNMLWDFSIAQSPPDFADDLENLCGEKSIQLMSNLKAFLKGQSNT